MEALLSNEAVKEIVITVFGAGLATGFFAFILAHGVSGALKILKTE